MAEIKSILELAADLLLKEAGSNGTALDTSDNDILKVTMPTKPSKKQQVDTDTDTDMDDIAEKIFTGEMPVVYE